jgi:hypothetical protein
MQEKRVISEAISKGEHSFRIPLLMRIVSKVAPLRGLPARAIGFGFGRECGVTLSGGLIRPVREAG